MSCDACLSLSPGATTRWSSQFDQEKFYSAHDIHLPRDIDSKGWPFVINSHEFRLHAIPTFTQKPIGRILKHLRCRMARTRRHYRSTAVLLLHHAIRTANFPDKVLFLPLLCYVAPKIVSNMLTYVLAWLCLTWQNPMSCRFILSVWCGSVSGSLWKSNTSIPAQRSGGQKCIVSAQNK